MAEPFFGMTTERLRKDVHAQISLAQTALSERERVHFLQAALRTAHVLATREYQQHMASRQPLQQS